MPTFRPDTPSFVKWAADLNALVELIELNADDPERVRALAHHRHEVAAANGFNVHFFGTEGVSKEIH